jgi:hypothetical protein
LLEVHPLTWHWSMLCVRSRMVAKKIGMKQFDEKFVPTIFK